MGYENELKGTKEIAQMVRDYFATHNLSIKTFNEMFGFNDHGLYKALSTSYPRLQMAYCLAKVMNKTLEEAFVRPEITESRDLTPTEKDRQLLLFVKSLEEENFECYTSLLSLSDKELARAALNLHILNDTESELIDKIRSHRDKFYKIVDAVDKICEED